MRTPQSNVMIDYTIKIPQERFNQVSKMLSNLSLMMRHGAAESLEQRIEEAKAKDKGEYYFCAGCGKIKYKEWSTWITCGSSTCKGKVNDAKNYTKEQEALQ
jgi:hypothetical protein